MSMTKGTPASSQIIFLEQRMAALESENENLRTALRPFVCECSSNCEWERDEICPNWNARAELEGK